MRVLHIAPTLIQSSAAWRLRVAQEELGVEAIALAEKAGGGLDAVAIDSIRFYKVLRRKILGRLTRLPLILFRQRDRSLPWSTAIIGRSIADRVNALNPDVVNLHWLSGGFMNLRDLEDISCPIVLTLHDVWAITGGCHCNMGCDRWRTGCAGCPQLGRGPLGIELASHLKIHKKEAYLKAKQLAVVAPSKWLSDMAVESRMFDGRKIVNIPNCIPLSVFSPGSGLAVRRRLGIPKDKFVLGFGAVKSTSIGYKGYDLLIDALKILRGRSRYDIHLLVFGADQDEKGALPFDSSFVGTIDQQFELANIYRACDAFAIPSRQDNFPNVMLEAASCGLPIVAFDIGGIPEMVLQGETGYIAKAFDVSDFASGIEMLLNRPDLRTAFGKAAAVRVSNLCSPYVVSRKYLTLYEDLLNVR